MTLLAWTQLIASDLLAAKASGLPHLWNTEFKTSELEQVLHEISILRPTPLAWMPGDTPFPRPNVQEPARVCLVTCERKGIRYVTKAQYNFTHARWFFDDPPSGPVKIVAWMDAPPPYLSDVLPAAKPTEAEVDAAAAAS